MLDSSPRRTAVATADIARPAKHWSQDPRLRDSGGDGETISPTVSSREFSAVGSWEEERAQLINTIRFLVMEVRDLFSRVAEHDDAHFHHRV